MKWEELDYWQTKDWQIVQERLDALDKSRVSYNPNRSNIFRSMLLCPMASVKVVILGQDPYPNPDHATGLAFSLPHKYDIKKAPATWQNIRREYCTDLSKQSPKTGSFETWAKQGVLLWNVIPTCETWKSLSHDWEEYGSLTQDILKCLSETDRGMVFVFLGSKARKHSEDVELTNQKVKSIYTSHPAPRGALKSNPYLGTIPFLGSRLFSTTNNYLNQLGLGSIDWTV